MKTKLTESENATRKLRMEETHKQILGLEDKTVYARSKHRSPSGQSEVFDFYIVGKNRYTGMRELLRVTYGISLLLGTKLDAKHEGIKVKGCNFDRAFEPIYSLFTFVFKLPDWQNNYRVERI